MVTGIYSEEHKELVHKLRQARHRASLSQCEVARLLGRSQSYVSKLESGQRVVSVWQLKELARLYGTDISHFIGDHLQQRDSVT